MKKFFIILTILTVCVNMRATDTLKLSLAKAIELALNENRSIKIAEKEIARANYAQQQNYGGLFPSLSGTAQYSKAVKKQEMTMEMGGQAITIKVGTDNSLTGGLTASLPLIAPGLWKSIQISKTDVDMALEKARSSKLSMTNEVKKAYFQALLAQDSYAVLQKSMKSAEQSLDNIRNMHGQGMVAEYDLIRADVRVRNMTPTLVMARDGVALSLMMVKVLLSLPEQIEVELSDNLEAFENAVLADEIPVTASLDRNTDLLQLELTSKKMKQQQQLVYTQSMPTLAAFGNYQFMGQGNDGAKMNFAYPLAVGFQLNVPIFSGLSKYRQGQQIKVGMEQLEIQKEYFRDNLNVQARNTINQMVRAKEQIASNKESVRLAEKGVEISQTRYKTGSGTLLEMDDSDLALVQARMNYYQSISDYLTAKAALQALLGKEE